MTLTAHASAAPQLAALQGDACKRNCGVHSKSDKAFLILPFPSFGPSTRSRSHESTQLRQRGLSPHGALTLLQCSSCTPASLALPPRAARRSPRSILSSRCALLCSRVCCSPLHKCDEGLQVYTRPHVVPPWLSHASPAVVSHQSEQSHESRILFLFGDILPFLTHAFPHPPQSRLHSHEWEEAILSWTVCWTRSLSGTKTAPGRGSVISPSRIVRHTLLSLRLVARV